MRICPHNELNCYDPLCLEGDCVRKHKHYTVPQRDHLWEIIGTQAETIGRLTRMIDEEHHHRKHHNKPILVLTLIINKQTFIMADIKLTLGATQKDGVFALLDTVTGAILTGVTFSKTSVGANSNPAAATFAIDINDPTGNSVLPTPLAAGSGTIGFAATASYTDSTGAAQTDVPFTIVKNFSVVLGADGVTLDILF